MASSWNSGAAAAGSASGNPPPASYHQLLDQYSALYDAAIQNYAVEPWVFPFRLLHTYLFLLYFILIPPSWLGEEAARGSRFRTWRRWVAIRGKYPVFALFVWKSIETILVCRSPATAWSYGIGLTNLFGIWWLAALFIFRDARFDAMRLEREKIAVPAPARRGIGPTNGVEAADGSASGVDGVGTGNGNVYSRSRTQGFGPPLAPNGHAKDTAVAMSTAKGQTEGDGYRYYWQPLPQPLHHRALWVLDLISSFRGAGWRHQIRTMDTPPAHVLAQLPPDQRATAKPACQGFTSTSALLQHNLAVITTAYVLWDILKTLMLYDTYFLVGDATAPPPPWFPAPLAQSAVLLRGVRTLFSGIGVVLLLRAWFSLSPLVFVGILGQGVLGLKAEPWLYPDVFGPLRAMLDHGVAGIWGTWWQQTFRLAFSAPAEALAKACGWDARRDPRAKLAALVLAFVVSGTIHAAASWTQVGPTDPWMPALYFPLQGVGMLAEMAVSAVCKRAGIAQRVPEGWKRWVRGAWVVMFIYLTAPAFADDMAAGGMWLFEPVPVSFMRGLGLGPVKEDGWLNWHTDARYVWWWTGNTWWQSGLAA